MNPLRTSAVLALLAAAACNSSTNANYTQTQTPVTPTGSMVIRVVDGSTAQPISGATVTVVGGTGASLTTDATGVAVFDKAVVASGYDFIVEAMGYIKQTSGSNALSESSGNSPLTGGTLTQQVTLYKADGTIKGVVFAPDGTPVAGVTVVTDQNINGYGESVVTAQTQADGTFTLAGVATAAGGAYHDVYAYPPSLGTDGTPTFDSANTWLWLEPSETGRVFLTFSQSSLTSSQRVLASNVLSGAIAPDSDIKFVFANPVLGLNLDGAAAQSFILTDNLGMTRAVTATWSSPSQVSVKPNASLTAGNRYSLSVSLSGQRVATNAAPDFSATFSFQARPANVTPITTQVTNLTVVNPAFAGTANPSRYDWNTNSFTLQWDGVTGATQYAIYAKDTKKNPDFVKLTTTSASGASRMVLDVNLPATFDTSPQLGIQPLAQGNTVTFAVVPADNYGYQAPLGAAASATVADNIQPTIIIPFTSLRSSPLFGTVDAINDDSAPAQWLFRIRYSEPMDGANPPTFTGQGGAMTSTVWTSTTEACPPSIFPCYYMNLTLTIQPGGDATGVFLVRGGKDQAGNVVLDGDFQSTLSGYKTLSNNPSFENSAGVCNLDGWTPIKSGTMPSPASVLATGQGGAGQISGNRCAAVLGAPTDVAPTGATGVSRIYQDINVSSIPTGSNWIHTVVFGSGRGTFLGPLPAPPDTCVLSDGSDVTLFSLGGGTGTFDLNGSPTSPYFRGNSILTPGTVRLSCKVDNSLGTPSSNNATFYVDTIGLYLSKPGAF